MLDDVLRTLIKKKYQASTDNFDIVINPEKGDLQIWRYRAVVEDGSEEAEEDDKITLTEAKKIAREQGIEDAFEVGEEVSEEIDLSKFGRRAIVQALQLLTQKIQEAERLDLYTRYKAYEGELIYAEVYHLAPNFAILHDNENNELFLPKENQIPGERYRKSSYLHAVIQEVSIKNGRLRITLSRTSEEFLRKILAVEIDEVSEGIVKIKKIARIPGVRAKVLVSTEDDRIDPVGTCVGAGGQRIRNISRRELWNEQVDIIGDTDNKEVVLKRALAPAQIQAIQDMGDRITLHIQPEQIPLAIGSNGQNIILASQLVGKPIDVYREAQGEVTPIETFKEEVDESILEKIAQAGLETVEDLIKTSKEELISQVPLTKEEAEELYEAITQKYAININVRSSPSS